EAHEPHYSLPRGLVWAQLTLILLVVLTWLFACGTYSYQELAVDANDAPVTNPLALPMMQILPRGLFFVFSGIALFGLIASYHGMIYGTSRQAFSLGRAGYLPAFLGMVHGRRRTPIAALLISSLVTAGFVLLAIWFREAIDVAVLVSTLTALIWYMLAM